MLSRSRSQFCVGRASLADGGGQLIEASGYFARSQELYYSAGISRRFSVQKHRAVRRQAVTITALGKKSEQREVIAQDSGASLRGAASLGCLCCGRAALSYRRENIQLDRCSNRCGPLISINCFEEKFRGKF